jgi:hypothetical protein
LQRESRAAQFRNQRDFYHLFGHIDAPVTVLAGRDDFPFVPPLQLPKADAANSGHIAGVVALLRRCSDRPGAPGFKHFGPLPFPSTNQCYQLSCTFAAASVRIHSTPTKSHAASLGIIRDVELRSRRAESRSDDFAGGRCIGLRAKGRVWEITGIMLSVARNPVRYQVLCSRNRCRWLTNQLPPSRKRRSGRNRERRLDRG